MRYGTTISAGLGSEPAHLQLLQIELAQRWRISPRTLEKWRQIGAGPRYLRVRGRVLYALSEIEAYEAASLRGDA